MSNEPDEVNSGALFTTLLLVAFVTLAVALVVSALVRQTTADVLVGKDAKQENAYRKLKSEQLTALNQPPAWTDRATGQVSVPLRSAMEMVMDEVRANPYALSPKNPDEEEEEEAEPEQEEGAEAEEPQTDGAEDSGAQDAAQETSPDSGSETAEKPANSAAPGPGATPSPQAGEEKKAPQAAPKAQPAPPTQPAPQPAP